MRRVLAARIPPSVVVVVVVVAGDLSPQAAHLRIKPFLFCRTYARGTYAKERRISGAVIVSCGSARCKPLS